MPSPTTPAAPLAAPIWTDAVNQPWSTAITVNTIARVRTMCAVELLDVFDGQLFARLAGDPELLVNVLYAVAKPQADERHVTPEQFAERITGDGLELAAEALIRGITFFFPKDRRTVLQKVWETTLQTQAAGMALALNKLESPLIPAAIEQAIQQASDEIDQRLRSFGAQSGRSLEQSASIPAS